MIIIVFLEIKEYSINQPYFRPQGLPFVPTKTLLPQYDHSNKLDEGEHKYSEKRRKE